MKIEFDPNKDIANQAKHGISLRQAVEMDFGRGTVIEDDRFEYDEKRYLFYGKIDGRLYVLYFTMRGDVCRVIGLRKANARERKRHEEA